MILILSKSKFDPSTEEIMDWLDYKSFPYLRLNGDDFYENIEITSDEGFKIKGVDLSEIKFVWFRRWINEDTIENIVKGHPFSKDENIIPFIHNIVGELKNLRIFLNRSLKSKKWLSYPSEVSINKLEVLQKAKKVGISIPKTIITTRKSHLSLFLKENKRIITKPISNTLMFDVEEQTNDSIYNVNYSTKTFEVTTEHLGQLEETFFPSLFQELIPKEYELRIFYLDNKFYPMAIFSQLDEKTSIDFRNYNTERPNRTIPYCLPQSIEIKLKKLIDLMNMTTGSIDLIKSQKNEYIFLEINPIGQFGMTSKPCNYYLEEIIADYLIQQCKNEI